jgi:hypothetical protein
VSFTHQRGTLISSYLVAAASGSFLRPLWQGYQAVGQGNWRWVMRWGAILCGLIILLMFLFLDESLFYRKVIGAEVNGAYVQAIDTVPGEKAIGDSNNTSKEVLPGTIGDTAMPTNPAPTSRFALWRNYPVSWRYFGTKMLASVTSVTYPAVLWVSILVLL